MSESLVALMRSLTLGVYVELFVARVVSGSIQDSGSLPMTYAETGNMDGSADLYAQCRIAAAPGSA